MVAPASHAYGAQPKLEAIFSPTFPGGEAVASPNFTSMPLSTPGNGSHQSAPVSVPNYVYAAGPNVAPTPPSTYPGLPYPDTDLSAALLSEYAPSGNGLSLRPLNGTERLPSPARTLSPPPLMVTRIVTKPSNIVTPSSYDAAQVCVCGNRFMDDSNFCRKCGQPRSIQAQMPQQIISPVMYVNATQSAPTSPMPVVRQPQRDVVYVRETQSAPQPAINDVMIEQIVARHFNDWETRSWSHWQETVERKVAAAMDNMKDFTASLLEDRVHDIAGNLEEWNAAMTNLRTSVEWQQAQLQHVQGDTAVTQRLAQLSHEMEALRSSIREKTKLDVGITNREDVLEAQMRQLAQDSREDLVRSLEAFKAEIDDVKAHAQQRLDQTGARIAEASLVQGISERLWSVQEKNIPELSAHLRSLSERVGQIRQTDTNENLHAALEQEVTERKAAFDEISRHMMEMHVGLTQLHQAMQQLLDAPQESFRRVDLPPLSQRLEPGGGIFESIGSLFSSGNKELWSVGLNDSGASKVNGHGAVLVVPPTSAWSAQSGYGVVMEQEVYTVRVTFISANNLQHSNSSGDNVWCQCVILRDRSEGAPVSCRSTTESSLNPEWNESHLLNGWRIGEALEFTLFDQGLLVCKSDGVIALQSNQFYPEGGRFSLHMDGSNATLVVAIELLHEAS